MPSRGSMRPSDIGASLCGHLRACMPSESRPERPRAVSTAVRRPDSVSLWLEATSRSSLRCLQPCYCIVCLSILLRAYAPVTSPLQIGSLARALHIFTPHRSAAISTASSSVSCTDAPGSRREVSGALKGRACPQSTSTAPCHPATAPAAVPAGRKRRAPAAFRPQEVATRSGRPPACKICRDQVSGIQ